MDEIEWRDDHKESYRLGYILVLIVDYPTQTKLERHLSKCTTTATSYFRLSVALIPLWLLGIEQVGSLSRSNCSDFITGAAPCYFFGYTDANYDEYPLPCRLVRVWLARTTGYCAVCVSYLIFLISYNFTSTFIYLYFCCCFLMVRSPFSLSSTQKLGGCFRACTWETIVTNYLQV